MKILKVHGDGDYAALTYEQSNFKHEYVVEQIGDFDFCKNTNLYLFE